MEVYRGEALQFTYPGGWRLHSAEHPPYLRRYRLDPPSAPPLLMEQHLRSKVDPFRYAMDLTYLAGPVGKVRLGGRPAAEARTLSPGFVRIEEHSVRSVPQRERRYYVFRMDDSLWVASYEVPRARLQRWRLQRLYRKVLGSLRKL